MKKLTLIFALLLLCGLPAFSSSTTEPITTTSETAVENRLVVRLIEINEMDKSSLSRSEKKELRNEVKTIKKELGRSNTGVYVSTGALIIIILLLIILL